MSDIKSKIKVSAPGKLYLSGEYAVLENGCAVVTSIDTRAQAIITDEAHTPSVFQKAVYKEFLIKRTNTLLPNIKVDTSQFKKDGKKLGLGSSAAATAATYGVLYEWSKQKISKNKYEICDRAIIAHKNAQGGYGSGGDVAASVFGETLYFQSGKVQALFPIKNALIVPVFLGYSADTCQYLKKIKNLKNKNAEKYESIMADLKNLSLELSVAYQHFNTCEIINLTQKYGIAMGYLGEAASIEIVTKDHLKISLIAKSFNGAAKPSGAGGGDMSVGIFHNKKDALAFKNEVTKSGYFPLNSKLSVAGLRRGFLR